MTMKYLIMFLASLGLLAALTLYAAADSVNRSFYNGNGSFAGSSVTRGKSTSLYDGRGHYTGSIIHTGPRR
jgi:hypothetical protein